MLQDDPRAIHAIHALRSSLAATRCPVVDNEKTASFVLSFLWSRLKCASSHHLVGGTVATLQLLNQDTISATTATSETNG